MSYEFNGTSNTFSPRAVPIAMYRRSVFCFLMLTVKGALKRFDMSSRRSVFPLLLLMLKKALERLGLCLSRERQRPGVSRTNVEVVKVLRARGHSMLGVSSLILSLPPLFGLV